jgi:hypothetical protein
MLTCSHTALQTSLGILRSHVHIRCSSTSLQCFSACHAHIHCCLQHSCTDSRLPCSHIPAFLHLRLIFLPAMLIYCCLRTLDHSFCAHAHIGSHSTFLVLSSCHAVTYCFLHTLVKSLVCHVHIYLLPTPCTSLLLMLCSLACFLQHYLFPGHSGLPCSMLQVSF